MGFCQCCSLHCLLTAQTYVRIAYSVFWNWNVNWTYFTRMLQIDFIFTHTVYGRLFWRRLLHTGSKKSSKSQPEAQSQFIACYHWPFQVFSLEKSKAEHPQNLNGTCRYTYVHKHFGLPFKYPSCEMLIYVHQRKILDNLQARKCSIRIKTNG